VGHTDTEGSQSSLAVDQAPHEANISGATTTVTMTRP
jgi:hypothetical protein